MEAYGRSPAAPPIECGWPGLGRPGGQRRRGRRQEAGAELLNLLRSGDIPADALPGTGNNTVQNGRALPVAREAKRRGVRVEGFGTLRVGAPGDASILEPAQGPVGFVDTRNNRRSGDHWLKPVQTVKAGRPFGRPFPVPFAWP